MKRRNFPPRRTYENTRRVNPRNTTQCYDCKGYGYMAVECANKNKSKAKDKAMTATWDEDFDEFDHESLGSDDESFQDVRAFIVFTELLEEGSSSEVEGDDEGEQDL